MSDLLEVPFKRQPNMVTRKVAGEMILVPVTKKVDQDAALFTLDETAAFLWEQIDGNHTGRDLVSSLQTVYSVDGKQAENDVQSFLDQLKEIDAIAPAHS